MGVGPRAYSRRERERTPAPSREGQCRGFCFAFDRIRTGVCATGATCLTAGLDPYSLRCPRPLDD